MKKIILFAVLFFFIFFSAVYSGIQIPTKGVVARTGGLGLNLRVAAGNQYSVVTTIPEGDSFEILGVSGQWFQVKYNSRIGFVYSYYVDVTENKEINDQNAAQNPIATLMQTDPNKSECKNIDPKIVP
ncbi:MAG: SH3 domain-containing protein [Candidatus Riflebacteria bacterium]|nr:SH3 domain-containing protein [Candidatus Riflebacteria bacterium]